jgi:DNA-binding response OmpR family regulator
MPRTVPTPTFAAGWLQVRVRLNRRSRAYHRLVAGPEVLVVEDDEGIGRSLVKTLAGQGYDVGWARTGAEALALVGSGTDLVVLDLGLPDIDGLEVCRRLRQRSPSPQVLVLTARREEADVVLGLDAGADDYLVKPFRLAELLARVRARVRRSAIDDDELRVGDLVVNVGAHRVTAGDVDVELRPKEFALLVALAREAGRVVPREQLMADVWDDNWYGSTKTLDIHVWALRRKLDRPGQASRISTVRGVGYRLDAA